ncbi:Hypothetical protein CpCap5W_0168 [Corynebacterium pseudotuberculosis]|uniref:Uncharacterized protein n=1 Tax=Corynebacterium pseudotuberculosis (strain C231) TaxID=681645 RepID=D9QDS8_CORP2|nr:hypothetical protein CPC231_00800 [Corynebacterium pseudotuberculosis C231]ADL20057.1 hypothetical protein CP1002_00800 [Corynebacterium pseudotuberculosis 1002]ADO25448.1 hypothetical protein CPI19_00800 [Corynebacterium pseudotuberculosis I19]AEK91496.1 Hypothetical protein CpPAT10_0154 [Corynebacterium pseudotuberculosis PAT10]AEP69424.1 Hypothetical protein Cp4202_0150 [Corynebacterium pseudotuberculosis 42/02-A]AEX38629.1 Hypothetical protein Cp3995_0154 [Corynebacterium pseudotubercul
MYFEAACFAFQQRGFHILVHACIFIHIIGVTHKREILLIGLDTYELGMSGRQCNYVMPPITGSLVGRVSAIKTVMLAS